MEPISEKGWKSVLENEFQQPYMTQLRLFLKEEYTKHIVYPPAKLVFTAFNITPLDNVKVVILGQDPYHKIGQAHGLAFSVPKNIKPPPSLKNIYKALKNDYESFQIPNHGNLSFWAEQGVLLLNSTLTVRESTPGSHQNQGWEQFTNKIIQLLSDKKKDIVFLLWGKPAQQKEKFINSEKNYILKTVHPSPLSAHRGFLTCKHFSQTNNILIKHGKTPINWQIPFNIP